MFTCPKGRIHSVNVNKLHYLNLNRQGRVVMKIVQTHRTKNISLRYIDIAFLRICSTTLAFARVKTLYQLTLNF